RHVMMIVSGRGPLGCDIEPVVARTPRLWEDLLGSGPYAMANHLAAASGESPDDAATRLWAAGEALKKAGVSARGPLTIGEVAPDGWVAIEAGPMTVITFVAELSALRARVAIAVAARRC